MNDLLLTYIVPVHNTEALLLRCLQSIVNQGLASDEYEVIVVDDGSTDNSRVVVQEFALDHPQVRLFTQSNAGVSAARNLAMDNARGRYLQFVDSDDYLMLGVMSSLVQRMLAADLDVLVFNYKSVDADGNILPIARNDNYPSSTKSTGVEYLEQHSMTLYVWRFLLSRDFINQAGWRFNESLIVCEDGALITRFLLNARRVAHDQALVYCYVNRGDSAMHNPDPEHLRRRILSQVSAAASINEAMSGYRQVSGREAPVSVAGVRNVYLYFAMTKALTCGCVDEVLERIKQAGLYPFPCVGPEANYHGVKWRIIHCLMMCPRLWKALSKVYRMLKK